jgi:hypothetical protein
MNIFAISGNEETGEIDWVQSARDIDDLRCSKMFLESLQLLSTALNVNGMEGPYRSFNPKHPSCMWVSESFQNFQQLLVYTKELEAEYHRRYDNKHHKCSDALKSLVYDRYAFPLVYHSTPLRLAMPEEFKSDNPVVSYRRYWISKRLVYKRARQPEWVMR